MDVSRSVNLANRGLPSESSDSVILRPLWPARTAPWFAVVHPDGDRQLALLGVITGVRLMQHFIVTA